MVVKNDDVITSAGITPSQFRAVEEREVCYLLLALLTTAQRRELSRRNKKYRNNRPVLELKDHIVIVVDDGIATGATIKAALRAIRGLKPFKIVAAVPCAAQDSLAAIAKEADETICLVSPTTFHAVGLYYVNFDQTEDEEVGSIRAALITSGSAIAAKGSTVSQAPKHTNGSKRSFFIEVILGFGF